MRIGYSEFSYGYAFTENLIRGSITAPAAAPKFPNLVEEGTLGYDIRIDYPAVPIFFQFKLPESMKKNSAFEIASGTCPGIATPFFRISLMRRDLSRQHQLLLDLEGVHPNRVFYAAPTFHTIPAFDTAYNAAEVAERSAFFAPRSIGALPDDKTHTIAYNDAASNAYFCSDPKAVAPISYEKLVAVVEQQLRSKTAQRLTTAARDMSDSVLSLATPTMRRAAAGMRDRAIARRRQSVDETTEGASEERVEVEAELIVAREVARVDLGVEMVIAQPR